MMRHRRKNSDRRLRRQRGFTLLELLVVLTILGLIAGLVGPRVLDYLGRAKSETASLQIKNLSANLDLFRLDVGRYPTQDEGLRALLEAPSSLQNWRGPYLRDRSALMDPWGKPYIYRQPGQNGQYDLLSLGSDGAPGGSGEAKDVVSN